MDDKIIYETAEERKALLKIYSILLPTYTSDSDTLSIASCDMCMKEAKQAYKVYQQEINGKNK